MPRRIGRPGGVFTGGVADGVLAAVGDSSTATSPATTTTATPASVSDAAPSSASTPSTPATSTQAAPAPTAVAAPTQSGPDIAAPRREAAPTDSLAPSTSGPPAIPPPPVSPREAAAQTREVLRTYFAPYDDPIKQELQLIQEVTTARKGDSRTYPPGENPYRIHYAVYNLRHPAVIDALAEAHRASVDVQILIEDGQLDPSRPWNTLNRDLAARGFTYSPTNVGLTPEQRHEINLIGITSLGLMHLKTRIFSYPDPNTGEKVDKVLSGSFNPNEGAVNNDETLHLIADPRIVERYIANYDAVLNDKPIENLWEEGAPVNVLFSRGQGVKPADKILDLISKEKEAIFISVFSLRNVSDAQRRSLVEELRKAKERGVEVTVITDRKQSDGVDVKGNRDPSMFDDPTDEMLVRLGIPVYECINKSGQFNAMHAKYAIFGLTDMKVVTDAGNWTNAALGKRGAPAKNDDSFLFVDSGQLDDNATGRRYLSNFLYLLRNYEYQQDAGIPKARDLVERFTKLPAWPKVSVDFQVIAQTYAGQEVYLTGDHEAFGNWTRSGPGLRLNTSGGTYPLWSTDASLELPFGISIEFKIVKRNRETGALEWEGGHNQLIVVDPADLRTPNADNAKRKMQVQTRFR